MLTASEAALARAVLSHGPISRSALTDRLGLSPASLTRLAKPFLSRGIMVETGEEPSGSIGRPARLLDISDDLGRFAGVKITGDRVYVVETDVHAGAQASIERKLSRTDPQTVARTIVEALEHLSSRPSGVGICLGGSVRDGIVERGPFLGWTNVPFADILDERVQVPVVLENDVVALAEAERWFGYGRGSDGFLVLTIGAGVGYALVIRDGVVRSPDTGLGLASHLVVGHDSDGRPQEAGELLTTESISMRVSSAVGRPTTYDQALQLAGGGDPAAVAVVEAAADALGRLIGLATTLTQQNVVVLAGEGVGLMSVVGDRVMSGVRAHRHNAARDIELFVDRTGFSAWARGAAAVAIQDAIARLRLR